MKGGRALHALVLFIFGQPIQAQPKPGQHLGWSKKINNKDLIFTRVDSLYGISISAPKMSA